MIYYKLLILILSICKYDILFYVMSSFSIKTYFWKLKEHVTSSIFIEK
jgi:hypothetical protein